MTTTDGLLAVSCAAGAATAAAVAGLEAGASGLAAEVERRGAKAGPVVADAEADAGIGTGERSKSTLIGAGAGCAWPSWRALRRRNQSMTALALPLGVGPAAAAEGDCDDGDDDVPQLASRSAEKRLCDASEPESARLDEGGREACLGGTEGTAAPWPGWIVSPWACTVLARSRPAAAPEPEPEPAPTLAAAALSTLARAPLGSFELTLWRNGCRLMAFCRRVDLRRFVTSSSGASLAGRGGTGGTAGARTGGREVDDEVG